MRGAVVVTSDPALFATTLASRADLVSIYDSTAVALEHVGQHHPAVVVADLLPCRDGVSGQRLLQKLLSGPPPKPRVYLMANSWDAVQQQWTMKLGAAGTILRDPAVVASLLLGNSSGPSKRELHAIVVVDQQFSRFAGPMAKPQLARLKATLRPDELADVPGYVERLAELLDSASSRKAFLQSVQHIPGAETTTAQSSVGDPWMHGVNQLFARYAGGLAARMASAHALSRIENNGVFSRAAYVNELASQLIDRRRATLFLDAVNDAKLND